MPTTKEKDRAKDQAGAQFESIKEMVERLNSDNENVMENARDEIQEDPLTAQIIKKYEILLCTGGPAVRITGYLDNMNQPETATLEYQDWFTPWKELYLDSDDDEVLLNYALQFYFGE